MRRFVVSVGIVSMCIVGCSSQPPSETAAPGAAAQSPADAGNALVEKARGIHERVLTLDTHDDIDPENFTKEKNYTQRLETQVNLPKMLDGGLDASFFIAYVGQGPLTKAGYDDAYKQVIAKFDAVHRLTEEIAPDRIGLALTAADVRRIAASGKKVALIGVENGYGIGTDLTRVKEFYDRGGRYMSLAHNGHSQLADSNTGERDGKWLHNGLSDLGKQVIGEMNRLGMMVDVSHPAKTSNLQAIALSKAPVIASHSSARALANHSRNLDDEQLQAIKKNGGVVQTVAFSSYVKVTKPDSPERAAAIAELRKEFGLPAPAGPAAAGAPAGPGATGTGATGGNQPAAGQTSAGQTVVGQGGAGQPAAGAGQAGSAQRGTSGRRATGSGPAAGGGGGGFAGFRNALRALPPEKRAEYDAKLAEIDKRLPGDPRATVADFVNHIDYLVKTIGIDHVGISSDFDGGGGVTGWNGAEETFNVTLELVRRGYTEQQIAQIWSGNLLRVMEQVEKVAAQLQAGTQ